MTDFQKQVLFLFEEGYAVSEIAKMLGRNITSVSSVRKRFDIKVKKSLIENTVNHTYLDTIDSDKKAYFLGFLIADGTLESPHKRHYGRICFNIQQDDLYILEEFKKELNSTNTISIKYNNRGVQCRKPQASFRFTSKPIYDILINKYKILPTKTFNFNFKFPFETISEEYWGAFIRGFIDGDGSFEQHKGTFNPTIIGTSKEWLLQIGEIIKNKTDLDNKLYEIQGKTCKYYTMRFIANNCNKYEKIQKLNNFLYNNAEIYLKRKKDKIDAYLEYRAKQISKKDLSV